MVVDPLGLGIFLLGIALVVAELAQPGYYIGVAGTVGAVVGLLQMAYPAFLTSWWSPFIVTIVAILATIASIQFYKRFAPPTRVPETLSSDALIGKTGRVVTAIVPNATSGKVKIGGIVWSADANEAIPEDVDVVVTRVEGVHLIVARVEKTGAPESISGQMLGAI